MVIICTRCYCPIFATICHFIEFYNNFWCQFFSNSSFPLSAAYSAAHSDSVLQLFPYLDKILHFLIFFLLTFILDFCTRKPLREHFCLILLLIGFGVFIEVSQYFTTTRSAEFLDGLCDFLGVLVYLLFAPNISIGLKK